MQSFDTQELLSGRAVSDFRSAYLADGIVRIRNFLDVASIQAPMHDLLSLLRKVHGWPAEEGLTGAPPDTQFRRLQEEDAKTAELALRIARDMPALQHLITHPALRAVISILLEEDSLIMPYDWCLFRIDGPSTTVSRFDWHQDYPYNVISRRAVTFWIPMTDVTDEMGCLRYVPESHHEILPVEIPESFEMNNPNRLHIKQTPQLQELIDTATTTGPVSAGDALLFNCLVLHASGENRSERYRWIANGRYAPATDPHLIERAFYMARTKYPDYFRTAHPEYVS